MRSTAAVCFRAFGFLMCAHAAFQGNINNARNGNDH